MDVIVEYRHQVVPKKERKHVCDGKKQILVTIGREFGSGGHELAAILSQRLQIRMLDRELIDELGKISEKLGELAEKYDEHQDSVLWSRRIGEFSNSISDNIAHQQFALIRRLADTGESLIIVGRCADQVLAGRQGLLRIFVRADLPHRISRIREKYQTGTDEEALRLIRKTDKSRKNYYRRHGDHKWGDSDNYDLTVNTSTLGLERTADLLEAYIRAFWETI